jgi:hypothetical protein
MGIRIMTDSMEGAPPETVPRTAPALPVRKLIVAGVVIVLFIVVTVVAKVVSSDNAISAGDCVVTNPDVMTGWSIKKVSCDSDPDSGLTIQQVVSVQSGSGGQCDMGLTTFQDDPNNETYCLEFINP